MRCVKVRAPATIANVVCGFDCIGFAVENPFDEISVELINEKTVRIEHIDNFNLPTEANKNVAGRALLAMLEKVSLKKGFKVTIKKGMKPGSGIGSSAASAIGSVFAANELLGKPFNSNDLIEFALEGEFLASGSKHADNLAPCLLGGFVLVRSVEPLDIVRLNSPKLFVTIIHPQIEIKTSEARSVLPERISLKDAVSAWANVGALVASLEKKDYELLARSLKDKIIEPVRKRFIPKFDEMKQASLMAGAIGGGIAGSGPSVFMLSKSEGIARKVEKAIAEVFASTGIDFKTYVSRLSSCGVVVEEFS
ncbi:MAG: homoserine kinase [Pyrinomonadaceae bacterium]|nr:homoserine kinase [Pyrinomonadaceae bacterium]MCX7640009.1 homoserine kinase [Pyrinomonadaceae bacterium]MDW8304181.1 homoserine kinase [Acidobacteriota bacterium]